MCQRRGSLLAVGLVALSPWASASQAPTPSPSPSPSAAPAAKSWEVPEDMKSARNPMTASAENLKKGETLFKRYCIPCHGPEGRGDGPIAHYWKELPKNLSDPQRQDRLSDGEMFWKMSRGHRQGAEVIMPAFAERIPKAEDRWRLVLFVRTLRQGPVSSPSASPAMRKH
jgi:mono/diheme cytochrome c family protein